MFIEASYFPTDHQDDDQSPNIPVRNTFIHFSSLNGIPEEGAEQFPRSQSVPPYLRHRITSNDCCGVSDDMDTNTTQPSSPATDTDPHQFDLTWVDEANYAGMNNTTYDIQACHDQWDDQEHRSLGKSVGNDTVCAACGKKQCKHWLKNTCTRQSGCKFCHCYCPTGHPMPTLRHENQPPKVHYEKVGDELTEKMVCDILIKVRDVVSLAHCSVHERHEFMYLVHQAATQHCGDPRLASQVIEDMVSKAKGFVGAQGTTEVWNSWIRCQQSQRNPPVGTGQFQHLLSQLRRKRRPKPLRNPQATFIWPSSVPKKWQGLLDQYLYHLAAEAMASRIRVLDRLLQPYKEKLQAS